jgi:hypothetical protein
MDTMKKIGIGIVATVLSLGMFAATASACEGARVYRPVHSGRRFIREGRREGRREARFERHHGYRW